MVADGGLADLLLVVARGADNGIGLYLVDAATDTVDPRRT
jgi:hypothetical protein